MAKQLLTSVTPVYLLDFDDDAPVTLKLDREKTRVTETRVDEHPADFLEGYGITAPSVSEPSAGNLGNFRFDCPTDPYEQQALCAFALATLQPLPPQIDPTPWQPGVGSGSGSGSGSPSDDFQNPNPGSANRNVVVILRRPLCCDLDQQARAAPPATATAALAAR